VFRSQSTSKNIANLNKNALKLFCVGVSDQAISVNVSFLQQ